MGTIFLVYTAFKHRVNYPTPIHSSGSQHAFKAAYLCAILVGPTDMAHTSMQLFKCVGVASQFAN